MNTTRVNSFFITGIAIRTTNENGASANDIPQLWNKFLSEKIAEQVSGKTNNDIYCLYTDYEKDFTKPYTVILGCRVAETAPVQNGFTRMRIAPGNYDLFTAKGNLQEGIVFREWTGIWNSPVKRAYTTDFEVYGEKDQNPANAEVDIFVAIE
jgi:predicted transcriptional regulator YdeE